MAERYEGKPEEKGCEGGVGDCTGILPLIVLLINLARLLPANEDVKQEI